MNLEIDNSRRELNQSTGIYVRAKSSNGTWASVDIAALTATSLRSWLRSRGGENEWAENVVGILLGHGHLWRKDGSSDEGEGRG